MKLVCACEHVFRDDAGSRGHLASETELSTALEQISSALAELVAGHADRAALLRWSRTHIGSQYPASVPPRDVIADFVSQRCRKHGTAVYECARCGRLLVERPDDEHELLGYAPDTRPTNRILSISTSREEPRIPARHESQRTLRYEDALRYVRSFTNGHGEPVPYDAVGAIHLALAAIDNLAENHVAADLDDLREAVTDRQRAFLLALADSLRDRALATHK